MLAGAQVELPALHNQLPLQARELARLGDALLVLHTRIVERREDGRDEEGEKVAALKLVDQVERRLRVVVGLAGVADHERHHGEPVIFVRDAQAFEQHAGPLVNRKRHAFRRHDLLRHAHGASLKPDEWREDFLLRMVAHHGDVNGAFGQKNFRQPLDQHRVHDERRHGGVAQHVLLDAGRFDDRRIQIQQRFAVGEEEGRAGLHLAPDEHVFGGERNLLVALRHVRAHAHHDFFFRHVNLRVEVGHAELAAAPAARGHLDHAESCPSVGHQDAVARSRVGDVGLARQSFAPDRLAEKLQSFSRLASALDDAVHAQRLEAVRLGYLPAA